MRRYDAVCPMMSRHKLIIIIVTPHTMMAFSTPQTRVTHAPKISEVQRRQLMLSPCSVNRAVNYDCTPSRNSYPCPNDGKCKDFKARSEGPDSILALRRRIWLHSGEKSSPTLSNRRSNFVNVLSNMNRTEENRIAFSLDGVYVCKSYFKEASGISYLEYNSLFASLFLM